MFGKGDPSAIIAEDASMVVATVSTTASKILAGVPIQPSSAPGCAAAARVLEDLRTKSLHEVRTNRGSKSKDKYKVTWTGIVSGGTVPKE